MKTETIELQAEKTPMRAYVARPDHGGKAPGVIVLQEAFGVNKHIRAVTERVASLGYVAIAPELFHRTAPAGWEGSYGNFDAIRPHYEAATVEALESDLRLAHRWLTSDGQVDPSRTAAIGFCMGGRAAFIANSALPLKAAVSYYGGGIAQTLLSRAQDQRAPILLIWGGKDQHIGVGQQRQVSDALRAAKKDFVDVEFSYADHGFNCDDRPSYHPRAARAAWALTAEFLKAEMAGES